MRASPSALKRFDCPRRWAFSRFANFPREDKPWFKFGRDVDQMGERYLRTGERPLGKDAAGALFLRMLPLLPPPGAAQTQVELDFDFDGHTIRGFADLVYAEPDHSIPVVLGDLKTFGNRAFILTETTIHEDPQVVGYAGALCQKLDQPAIRARWTYGDKRAVRAHPVDAVIHRDQNLAIARKKFLPVLDSMDLLCKTPPSTVAEINQIPNDPSQCDGCGKNCDYAVHCQLYQPRKISMAETIQERIERLKAGKGAGGGGGNPPAEAAKALEETKKEIAAGADPVADLEARLNAARAAKAAEEAAAAKAAEPETKEKKTRGPNRAKAAGALGKVATDPITGMAGTVTARQEHLGGHEQLLLEPQSADGKSYGRWFHADRLQVEGD